VKIMVSLGSGGKTAEPAITTAMIT